MNALTIIDDDSCLVVYSDEFITEEQSLALEKECLSTDLFQPTLKFSTVEVLQPRLISWLADDPAMTYTYSGVHLTPKPMPLLMKQVALELEGRLGARFSACLLNVYRDGDDSVSWHSDNEKELGANATIACVSIGAARRFELKHRKNKRLKHSIELKPRSLVVMAGQTQSKWLHQVPKESGAVGRRISLTFRPHILAT